MKRYNWEQTDWPTLQQYSLSAIEDDLFLFAEETGKVTGSLIALPDETKMEAVVEMMVPEAIKTSEIEGEYLSRKDVRSSIKNNLGLNSELEKVKDKQAAGIGELMIDVRNNFKVKLTQVKLFSWHTLLLRHDKNFESGFWRTHIKPVQVISGA